jgi:hypothetical protein
MDEPHQVTQTSRIGTEGEWRRGSKVRSFEIVVLFSRKRRGSWCPLVGHTRPNMRVD